MAKKKKQKEKVIYYDDNSTVADMSYANRKGEKRTPVPRKQSTFKEKWHTYWSAVKMMIIPMCFVLVVLATIFLLLLLLN